jgi:alkanesulfonate monooxygenase SsuD/methylene tetrahydromethanopterin reductase-like flavin-dependent oxidoreductase (luciferase family)
MSVPPRVAAPCSTKRPLKVGLQLPITDPWEETLAMARRAEEVGFDSLWLPDHLYLKRDQLWITAGRPVPPGVESQPPAGAWETWSLLSALMMAVPRVAIGTMVTCTGFRNPALLAKMAETVDAISGGRLILGLGSGDVAFEHHAFGYPFDHAVSRFEEALQIITALLREGECDFHGTYYEVNDLKMEPRGPRPNGPPILIGTLATGKRMLRLTAQYADLWNGYLCYGRNWPDVLPPLRDAIDAACVTHGRDPATLGRTIAVRVNLSGETIPGGVEPLEGSPVEIADAIRAYARGGITHLETWLVPSTLAGVEAFAPVLVELDREGA